MADERDTEDRVTIVDSGGGSSGGVLAVVLLVIVVLVLLFLFRDQLGFGGDDPDITIPDKVEVNVNCRPRQAVIPAKAGIQALTIRKDTRNDPLDFRRTSRGPLHP